MATKAAHKRLMKEYAAIEQSPPPFVVARPEEKNILSWYNIRACNVLTSGEFHGKLTFPGDYPFKPPSIQMMTPNAESWNPSWSVASILTGLLSFMLEETSTTGSIATSDSDKRFLARNSWQYNRTNNPKFLELFVDRRDMRYEPPAPLSIPPVTTIVGQ